MHRRILAPGALAAASLLLAIPASAASHSPGAPGIGDPYFPLDGNGGIDVLSYDVHDRYDLGTGRLSGWTDLRLRGLEPLGRRGHLRVEAGELAVELLARRLGIRELLARRRGLRRVLVELLLQLLLLVRRLGPRGRLEPARDHRRHGRHGRHGADGDEEAAERAHGEEIVKRHPKLEQHWQHQQHNNGCDAAWSRSPAKDRGEWREAPATRTR